MDLSSLIFLAIIGVWAAYLVPHWLRRRDDLVQSRTPDRFSGGLRVLQRRSRKPRPDRSGDAVLTSPRVIVDADGEYLYIPADRALAARLKRQADAELSALAVAVEEAPIAVADPAPVEVTASAPVPAFEAAPEPAQPEVGMTERPFDLEVAIGNARIAARRRAAIMGLLFGATALLLLVAALTSLATWIAAPTGLLLMAHALASRIAGLRSRETLMLLAVQVHASERALAARPQRRVVASPEIAAEAIAPQQAPDRVARRQAAVAASTWEPVPVPVPTYTLKPAVHRPEPAPLDLPAAGAPAAAAASAGPVSRGALPRRAAEIERILALESDLDELFEEPKVVNG